MKSLQQRPAGHVVLVTGSKVAKKGKNGRKGKRFSNQEVRTVMVFCPRFPPSFQASPTYKVRRRFTSDEDNAISGATFRILDGANQFLNLALSTTSALSYVDCWRIRKVSIWALNYVDNPTTVTFTPAGFDIDTNNFNDREQSFSCSSRSEAEPGRMCIKPAPDTPLGCWHLTNAVNTTGPLFLMTVDPGGANTGNWATVTMDIDFEFVLNQVGGPKGYTKTVPAGSLGTIGGTNWVIGGLTLFHLQSVNILA